MTVGQESGGKRLRAPNTPPPRVPPPQVVSSHPGLHSRPRGPTPQPQLTPVVTNQLTRIPQSPRVPPSNVLPQSNINSQIISRPREPPGRPKTPNIGVSQPVDPSEVLGKTSLNFVTNTNPKAGQAPLPQLRPERPVVTRSRGPIQGQGQASRTNYNTNIDEDVQNVTPRRRSDIALRPRPEGKLVDRGLSLDRGSSEKLLDEPDEVIIKDAYKEDNSIVIKWDSDVTNILGFRVVYRLFGKPDFKQGPPLAPSEREFRIKNVPANVSYSI